MAMPDMVARLTHPISGGFLPPEVNEARLSFEQGWWKERVILEEIDVYMGDDPNGAAVPASLAIELLDAQLEYVSTIKGLLDDAKRYDHTSKHNAADVLIIMKHAVIDLGLDYWLCHSEAQEYKSMVEFRGRYTYWERIGVTVNLKDGFQCVRVWRIHHYKILHEIKLMHGWIPKGKTLETLIREALMIARQEIAK